jgi:hypothetical protein
MNMHFSKYLYLKHYQVRDVLHIPITPS